MRSLIINNLIFWFLSLTSAGFSHCNAGGDVAATSNFSKPEIGNQINNGFGLQPIRDKMNQVDSVLTMIKVLHIGDSHIKSGYFSQPFMEKLNAYYAQKYKGNLFFNFQFFCKTGTKYSDYNDLAELDEQLITEKPDLVIVSLGTNDAFSGSARVNFYEKVNHLVTKIKTLSPGASILLTTPSGALKKDRSGIFRALPDLQNVANTIVRYANEHGIAYWNLHQIMGGDYAINDWYLRKLAAADRVHFTANGYNLLSDWLFEAFTGCLDNHFAKSSNF